MKIKAAVFFFFLFGAAFSQEDTTAVSVPDTLASVPDTLISAPDTLASVPDTIVSAPDTLISVPDTSVIDSSISKGLHFFIGLGAQFINFKDQAKFQGILEAQYEKYRDEYLEDSTGFLPKKQDFQTVNLAFPINIGLMWQFSDTHSLSLGAGFLYDNESVILTDKHGESHNLKYTLQAFPLFAEYRLQISSDLISMNNGDYFSLFFRYYWMLPGTEIYSTWGQAKADFEPLGNGYGVFLGYRFLNWQKISLWGELGFLSLDVKSSDKDAVLDSWNLGGISLLIRIMI